MAEGYLECVYRYMFLMARLTITKKTNPKIFIMQQTFLKLVSISVCQWGLFCPTCTFVPDNQQ